MNDQFSDAEIEKALREGLRHEAALTEVPDSYDAVRHAARRRPRPWVTPVAVAASLAIGFGGAVWGQSLLGTGTGSPVPGAVAAASDVSATTQPSRPASQAPRAGATVTVTVTVAPGAAQPGFDEFPVGYDHANLSQLEQVNGRWAVVLDPLTVCRSSTDKPECAGLKDPIPNESTTVNVSLKTYRVPLASSVVVQVLDGGAPPSQKPYLPVPLATKKWETPIEVVIAMSGDNEVTSIRQYWRP